MKQVDTLDVAQELWALWYATEALAAAQHARVDALVRKLDLASMGPRSPQTRGWRSAYELLDKWGVERVIRKAAAKGK